MDSLAEIKEELEQHFKCRYYQNKRFVYCIESNGILLFITNDISEIEQTIGYEPNVRRYIPYIKFEFSVFLQIIKDRPITNTRMMAHYKDYIITYQHQYRRRVMAIRS